MAGATLTIKIAICAPIPVGNDVVVQYWEYDAGIFGTMFQVDESEPSVIDRTTGIAYGTPWHAKSFFGFEPGEEEKRRKTRPARRVEGTVRGCSVFTHNGQHGVQIGTWLVLEVRGGYR
jgi:hypothetical protein